MNEFWVSFKPFLMALTLYLAATLACLAAWLTVYGLLTLFLWPEQSFILTALGSLGCLIHALSSKLT